MKGACRLDRVRDHLPLRPVSHEPAGQPDILAEIIDPLVAGAAHLIRDRGQTLGWIVHEGGHHIGGLLKRVEVQPFQGVELTECGGRVGPPILVHHVIDERVQYLGVGFEVASLRILGLQKFPVSVLHEESHGLVPQILRRGLQFLIRVFRGEHFNPARFQRRHLLLPAGDVRRLGRVFGELADPRLALGNPFFDFFNNRIRCELLRLGGSFLQRGGRNVRQLAVDEIKLGLSSFGENELGGFRGDHSLGRSLALGGSFLGNRRTRLDVQPVAFRQLADAILVGLHLVARVWSVQTGQVLHVDLGDLPLGIGGELEESLRALLELIHRRQAETLLPDIHEIIPVFGARQCRQLGDHPGGILVGRA